MAGLERKRALITGAGSGIGRAIALDLARRQTHLCLVDRNAESLEQTAELCLPFHSLVTTCVADLTQAAFCDTIHQHVQQTFGGLDLLVNNAGIVYHGSFDQMTTGQLDELCAVNFRAPLQLTLACLPWLLENSGSYVLNVSSMYAFVPTRRAAAYHATKAGLLGYSRALRLEYARYGLGVGCLCPGFVRTPLYENALTSDARRLSTPPAWISTTPEHVARVAIRMMIRNQSVKTITLAAWLAWHTRQWLPGLIDWAAHRNGRKLHPLQQAVAVRPPTPLAEIEAELQTLPPDFLPQTVCSDPR